MGNNCFRHPAIEPHTTDWEKREKYLLFLENFYNSECWDFTPDLLGVNSTQKQRQGLFFFFQPCLYYFPRSHKLLSPNDTALKETRNSEYPSGDLKKKKKKNARCILEANSKQLKAAAGGKWEAATVGWQTRGKGPVSSRSSSSHIKDGNRALKHARSRQHSQGHKKIRDSFRAARNTRLQCEQHPAPWLEGKQGGKKSPSPAQRHTRGVPSPSAAHHEIVRGGN